MSRFDRQERFFGAEGQRKLERLKVAIVGVGGIGTHVVQQLAYLGVGHGGSGNLGLIDSEQLDLTNRNRYIGSWHDDPIPGSSKVALAHRLVSLIDPSIRVIECAKDLRSAEAFELIKGSDVAIGCLDGDGARMVFNELCLAYQVPFLDLATDIQSGARFLYGGRVFTRWEPQERGCLVCMGEIDAAMATQELSNPDARRDRNALYGVDRDELDASGPSVVSLNGVIASLGVTELLCGVTGLRPATRFLNFRGHQSTVARRADAPPASCHYCDTVAGSEDDAGVDRYVLT